MCPKNVFFSLAFLKQKLAKQEKATMKTKTKTSSASNTISITLLIIS